jgi:hypothetical protein
MTDNSVDFKEMSKQPLFPKIPLVTEMSLPKPPNDPTRALIELICTSRLPFSIASDPALVHFVQAVQKHKDWKIPHRTTLAGPQLDLAYQDVVSNLRNEFKECDYIALTTDGTTASGGTSYWSITASGLDSQFVLRTAILACIPVFKNHTGENLAEILVSTLDSIGIPKSKVVAIVTDEGGGAPCISDHFPGVQQIFCAAHLLQTTLRRAFDTATSEFPELATVLTFSRRLAAIYNQSSIIRSEIQVLQARLSQSVSSLKQDVATRWLSQLSCLKSVLENEAAIKAWMETSKPKDPMLSHYNPETLWPILTQLVSILQPFDAATKCFSKEKEITLHETIDRVLLLKSLLIDMKSTLSQKMLNVRTKSALEYLIDQLANQLELKYENWSEFELVSPLYQ